MSSDVTAATGRVILRQRVSCTAAASFAAAYNYQIINGWRLPLLDTREIHSLTDFLRNHKAHMARLKETHAPEVLTVNGKAEVVIQDATSYQAMLDRLHHMETIAAIQEGMASAERGELKPAAQVFDEMRAKYGLSR
jgi:PHD/YefM family antitoxin component YafN of YafNO toxin-antitoxin module